MITIDKDSILHLKIDLPTLPKDIYLVGSEETARKEFKNAYILYYVDWHKVSGIFDFFTGLNIEREIKGTANHAKTLEIREAVRAPLQELQEVVSRMVTVIPFTPVKYIGAKPITPDEDAWSIHEGRLALRGVKTWSNSSPRTELLNFYNMLFETASTMGIILRGVFYDSPCVFCSSIFSKIASKCEIYNTENFYNKLCSPRIFFASHVMDIESEGESTLDYSSPAVKKSMKIEV